MAELFHLTERATWLAALATGEYRMSTRGVTLEEQGFIHCSLRHQLRPVAQRLYGDGGGDDGGDAGGLVVLVIDDTRVGAPVRYESPEPGAEAYPHVYGPLPADSVTAVLPVGRDGAGRLLLPD